MLRGYACNLWEISLSFLAEDRLFLKANKLLYSLHLDLNAMSSWIIVFFITLLVLGVVLFMATDKVRKDVYNPYFLKPMMLFFGSFGLLFLLFSFWFLFQL